MVSKHKKILIGITLSILISLSLAAGGGLLWMRAFIHAPAGTDPSPQLFTIAPGQGLSAIATNLKQEGLITDPLRFKLFARYKKAGTRIKAGEYQLAQKLSPEKILNLLISGRVKLYRFTIPEGLNMEEISRTIETAGICTKDDFLKLCRDKNFIRELSIPGHTLEGYLFPDTYLYPKTATCRQIIRKMAQGFNKVFTDKWKKRARDLGYSVHEIVTLASIIEKETGDATERPLISSVFHNRLKKKMRLESDPTVIYGVDDYHGRIRYRHLRRVTPYNTYQIRGLPLGPIANPGAKALEAALYPDESDYIFFVSKNDTTHKFSKTLKEHNKAVRKYQLGH